MTTDISPATSGPLPPPLPPSKNEQTATYIALGFVAMSALVWLFSGKLVGGFRDFNHYGRAAQIGAAVGAAVWLAIAGKALQQLRRRVLDIMQFSLIVSIALLMITNGARVGLLANQALGSRGCTAHDAFVMAPMAMKSQLDSLPDSYAVLVDGFDDSVDVDANFVPGQSSDRYTACVAAGALGSPWIVSLQLK